MGYRIKRFTGEQDNNPGFFKKALGGVTANSNFQAGKSIFWKDVSRGDIGKALKHSVYVPKKDLEASKNGSY